MTIWFNSKMQTPELTDTKGVVGTQIINSKYLLFDDSVVTSNTQVPINGHQRHDSCNHHNNPIQVV